MKINQNKMMSDDKKIFVLIIVIALILTVVFVLWPKETASQQLSKRAAFAACLSSKNIKMYGTDTCPSCIEQKGMFEEDFNRIQYINCAIHQDECIQNNIQQYPTWMYNGERLLGVHTFPQLGQFSGCTVP